MPRKAKPPRLFIDQHTDPVTGWIHQRLLNEKGQVIPGVKHIRVDTDTEPGKNGATTGQATITLEIGPTTTGLHHAKL